jgi:hypothetical protein
MLIIGLIVATTIGVNAQTRTMIKIQDLPKAITENLAVDHKDWKAIEAFKIDTKGVIIYDVIGKKDQQEVILHYNSDGKFLSKEPYNREKIMMKERPKEDQPRQDFQKQNVPEK